ncbi:hypothetical protein [Nannocystis exedens]|nr:hypothetical protein [Nannocystis exedens]
MVVVVVGSPVVEVVGGSVVGAAVVVSSVVEPVVSVVSLADDGYDGSIASMACALLDVPDDGINFVAAVTATLAHRPEGAEDRLLIGRGDAGGLHRGDEVGDERAEVVDVDADVVVGVDQALVGGGHGPALVAGADAGVDAGRGVDLEAVLGRAVDAADLARETGVEAREVGGAEEAVDGDVEGDVVDERAGLARGADRSRRSAGSASSKHTPARWGAPSFLRRSPQIAARARQRLSDRPAERREVLCSWGDGSLHVHVRAA